MKREIPCGVPWILPLVGQRDDVAVEHVKPFFVVGFSFPNELTIGLVRFHPFMNVKIIVLLAPQHSGQGLPEYAGFLLANAWRCDVSIEFIGLPQARSEERRVGKEWCCRWSSA